MKPLVLSPAAQADMEVIWDYRVEHWGLDHADRYMDDIRGNLHGLASGHRHGSPVDV